MFYECHICIYKVRGAAEDIEIVTLLLSNLALAVDHMEGEFDHMEGEFDVGKDRLAFLFHQFGSNLRKLQVGPSGDLMEMQQIRNLILYQLQASPMGRR